MGYRKAVLKTILFLFFLAAASLTASAEDAEYEKGVAYLRAGNVGEALRILEPLAVKEPGNPLVFYHLGLASYKADRLGQAFDAFSRTRALAGDRAQKDFKLSVAFLNVGIGHFRKKEYDRAGRCFSSALELDPGDGDSYYYLGLVKVEGHDYQAALNELGQAAVYKTADDREKALVLNAVGIVYFRQEHADKAMEEFGKTLALDPDNIEALYYLGLLNYKENGYAAAKPYFDRIAVRGTRDEKTRQSLFTTFFNMGVDFQNRDKAEAAAEMFGKASSLKPEDPDAHFYRGYNLMTLERYEEAVPEFRQALSLRPGMSRAEAQLEVAGKFASEKVMKAAAESMKKGECYAALALFEKAVSLDPGNREAKKGLRQAGGLVEKDTKDRVERVKAHLGKGEYREAATGAAELVRLNPASSEAAALEREARERFAGVLKGYLARAREAEERDALGEAAGYYERLLAADPDNKAASDALRLAKARIDGERGRAEKAMDDGQLAAAKKSYERLLKYLPGDAGVQGKLREIDEKIAAARIQEQAAPAPAAPPPAVSEEEVRRLYLLGMDYYTKGQLQEAVSAWRQVLKLDPANEKAISCIGKAEEKLKQTGKP